MVTAPEQEQGKADVEKERNGEDAAFVGGREGVGVNEIDVGGGKRGEEDGEGWRGRLKRVFGVVFGGGMVGEGF